MSSISQEMPVALFLVLFLAMTIYKVVSIPYYTRLLCIQMSKCTHAHSFVNTILKIENKVFESRKQL